MLQTVAMNVEETRDTSRIQVGFASNLRYLSPRRLSKEVYLDDRRSMVYAPPKKNRFRSAQTKMLKK